MQNDLTHQEQELIFSHFKDLEKAGKLKTCHFDCKLEDRPRFFIKYLYDEDVLLEASTQSFFYAQAEKSRFVAPGIPKNFGTFRRGGRFFFVMENIEVTTMEKCNVEDEKAIEKAAFAIKWLFDQMDSISSSVFGRISSKEDAIFLARVLQRSRGTSTLCQFQSPLYIRL